MTDFQLIGPARTIVDALCRRTTARTADGDDITAERVFSRTRDYAVTAIRQEAMWLLRDLTRQGAASLPWIARQFKRDHTTVLHSIRKIETRRQTDPAYAERLMQVRGAVRQVLALRQGVQLDEARVLMAAQ